MYSILYIIIIINNNITVKITNITTVVYYDTINNMFINVF